MLIYAVPEADVGQISIDLGVPPKMRSKRLGKLSILETVADCVHVDMLGDVKFDPASGGGEQPHPTDGIGEQYDLDQHVRG
jgi:hypothetical protein